MARKPPLLVALLTLLALGAAPAAADAATFSIASVAPAEVTEGMTASVVVTRNAPADHTTHVQVDGLPGERGVFFAPGATKQTVPVHSDFNDVVEPARVLDLSLSHPSAGDDVASGATRLVVHDDDVEFAEDELNVFESEGFVLLPLRRLDAARALPIYLRYVQGTTTPADLLPSAPNRLTLPAGQLNPTVRVPGPRCARFSRSRCAPTRPPPRAWISSPTPP